MNYNYMPASVGIKDPLAQAVLMLPHHLRHVNIYIVDGRTRGLLRLVSPITITMYSVNVLVLWKCKVNNAVRHEVL